MEKTRLPAGQFRNILVWVPTQIFAGTWSVDGLILFSPRQISGLYRVASTGGVPVQVTDLGKNSSSTHAFPDFLPDGRHFIRLNRS